MGKKDSSKVEDVEMVSSGEVVKVKFLVDTGLGVRGEYGYIDVDKVDVAVESGVVSVVEDMKAVDDGGDDQSDGVDIQEDGKLESSKKGKA